MKLIKEISVCDGCGKEEPYLSKCPSCGKDFCSSCTDTTYAEIKQLKLIRKLLDDKGSEHISAAYDLIESGLKGLKDRGSIIKISKPDKELEDLINESRSVGC